MTDSKLIDWSAELEKLEDWIRSGRAQGCAKALRKLNFKMVPRKHLVGFCALARRCGEVEAGLRALRPVLRRPNFATVEERVEYAKELMRVGAYEEARTLLNAPELTGDKDAVVARAYLCMYAWDYEGALAHFNQVAGATSNVYSDLVLQVNRLSCIKFLGGTEFFGEFERLLAKLGDGSHALLRANVLEIGAQHNIERKEWREAGASLMEARRLLMEEKSRNYHMVCKWEKILGALESGSIEKLEEFRKEALAQGEWETLRSLDYYQTRLNPDNPWALKVYFGTPYDSFRKKLEQVRSFPNEALVGAGSKEFDPWFPGEQEGSLAHKMIVLASRDLYRPLPTTEVFAALHPEERFDIDGIQIRVRQIVQRSRRLLDLVRAPVRFDSKQGGYSLRIQSAGCLNARKAMVPFDEFGFLFGRFADRSNLRLNTHDWEHLLKMSHGNTSKILNRAVKAGTLLKIKDGRQVLFEYPRRHGSI